MINGVHAMIYSPAAEALREYLRDRLAFDCVDAGGGWLIFAMPPLELGVHEADAPSHRLYLTCDDLDATMADLAGRGVEFSQPVSDLSWGRLTAIRLPDGSELGLYQPRHAQPRPASAAEDV